MKICRTCKKEKNEDEFYAHKQFLHSDCKICECDRRKRKRLENPEEYKKKKREYHEKNKEKIKKQVHENYLKNRESVLERTRIWRQVNSEKFKEYWKKSNEKNPQRRRARKILNDHLHRGKIIKGRFCHMCGKEKELHAHHENYENPLAVIWICTECHGFIHRELK